MAIKVKCGKCDAGFKAKDSLAGRRVKCPKCKEPLKIPEPKKATKTVAASPAPVASHNPLLDLLDEQNVRSAVRGPMCENCAGELEPGAIICMECGFNQETGGQLETEAYEDDSESGAESAMSDADRIMAKAERDIDDMPVAADDQDFGDGAASYLIAAVACVVGLIMIGIGIVVIYSMDWVSLWLNSGAISFIASCLLYFSMAIWITVVAFRQKPGHGIACICTGFLWCIVYGFMQGKTLLLPTVVLLAGFLIGAASGAYVSYNGWGPTEGSLQIESQDESFGDFDLAFLMEDVGPATVGIRLHELKGCGAFVSTSSTRL